MTFKSKKDDLLFVPLGGASEIGMNVNLYQYKGKWIMFDLGAGFADESMPGVDMVAPDLTFIAEKKDNLLGIVLTHAHEDHFGSVTYLWGQLGCPIYTTKFTASVLKAKLEGDGIPHAGEIIEVDSNSSFDIGPFSIELVQITHSIPEMNGALIKTDHGTIMHTGDWKIDPDPVVGPTTDEEQIRKHGDDGILAMVCDSTNVLSPGHSGSEGDLVESLTNIIGEQEGLVCVTTFASNVARIDTIARAAQANGRQVALLGRSLSRITTAAKESGYLDGIKFVDERHIDKIPRKELLCICTGCQGEANAATNRLVQDNHPALRILPGDTIIFSSKVIPGNEKTIFRMYNKLLTNGIEVITEKDHFVHVSGHPNRDELKQMYELVRPEISIPVHGEALHIHEHVKLAKSVGVPKQVEVSNGAVVRIAPGDPQVIGHAQFGYLGVDGYMLVPEKGEVLKRRRGMMREGNVLVSLVLDKKGKLVTEPKISTPGVVDEKECEDFLQVMREDVCHAVANARINKDEKIATQARKAVRAFMKREIGKFPAIVVHVARV